jgi:2-polyprenyl-3-methyl-5-hydroxy-6-metoxy-1,4-benzoquinol methylase
MLSWLRKRPDRPHERVMPEDLLPLIAVVNDRSQPNINALRQVANMIEPLSLNIKQMGYSLARQLAEALPDPGRTEARQVGLYSSLSTQKAIESDWVAHWCRELRIAVLYHRKVWELCFVLQALHETGMIRAGARGLGFGCGAEALPSYLAAHGVSITATDLVPERAAESGWVQTRQHMDGPEQAFMPYLVSRADFDRLVGLRYVDMNQIPDDLTGFDFCWSICALEHLGSIALGLDFIENAMKTLRPGGVAVHTTEYNIRADGPTIDNWPSVAFQRQHIEKLAVRLRRQGHHVTPFDFSLGDGPLDRFIDMPPYIHDLPAEVAQWLGFPAHLKVAFDGLVVTCIGLIIRKAEAG